MLVNRPTDISSVDKMRYRLIRSTRKNDFTNPNPTTYDAGYETAIVPHQIYWIAQSKIYLALCLGLLSFTGAITHAADSFSWVAKATCPLQRFEAMGGVAGGKLYQFSGYYTVGSSILATPLCHAYDPATINGRAWPIFRRRSVIAGQVADTDQASNSIFWLAGGFLGDHPGPSTTESGSTILIIIPGQLALLCLLREPAARWLN